jgi:hypothetical protein
VLGGKSRHHALEVRVDSLAVITPHHDWEFWWVDSDFLDDPRRTVRLEHAHEVSLGETGPTYRQIP